MDAIANHPHTDEQLDILTAASCTKDNLMIEALAGTGKSTTLLAIERIMPRGPALYLVFNTINAEKIMSLDQLAAERKKVRPEHSDDPKDRVLSTTTVRTFNSIGHRIWASSQSRKLMVDGKKLGTIYRAIIDEAPPNTRQALWGVYHAVLEGTRLAKALGYVPDDWKAGNPKRLCTQAQLHRHLDEVPDDLTSDLIDQVLIRSIKQAFDGQIDYDDQVYMPALWGGTFPKFPLVLVDEYQDLSPTNHALLERLCRNRVIGVGDPYQNIYGFRGAKAGGMSEAVKAYSMTTLPLSISFRCPSAIVRHVHWRVPHFKWHHEGGEVEQATRFRHDRIHNDTTIICRNNAPLFATAMHMLSSGKRVAIVGSDVGPRLVGIMRKLGPDSMTTRETLLAIDDWLELKLAAESKSAPDLAECMRIFAAQGKTLSLAIAYAEHLFKQTGGVRFTTGHKAKGLEWDSVIHLDPWLVRKDPSEQNKNLDYVISTRSRDHLLEINSEQIEW